MRKSVWISGVIAVCLFAGGLAGAAEKTTEQLLDEARKVVKRLSVQEVKKAIDGKEKVVLIDAQDMKDYQGGHIEGAVNMSRAASVSGRLLEHHMQKVTTDKDAKIIVYCQFDTRAPLAVKTLNEIGYKNAAYMIGGLKAWKDAGYPLGK